MPWEKIQFPAIVSRVITVSTNGWCGDGDKDFEVLGTNIR